MFHTNFSLWKGGCVSGHRKLRLGHKQTVLEQFLYVCIPVWQHQHPSCWHRCRCYVGVKTLWPYLNSHKCVQHWAVASWHSCVSIMLVYLSTCEQNSMCCSHADTHWVNPQEPCACIALCAEMQQFETTRIRVAMWKLHVDVVCAQHTLLNVATHSHLSRGCVNLYRS